MKMQTLRAVETQALDRGGKKGPIRHFRDNGCDVHPRPCIQKSMSVNRKLPHAPASQNITTWPDLHI
jgi:hypothetical protein